MLNPIVTVETTRGTFQVELFEKRAPKTTANFQSLIKKGFYDGVKFHRVIENFMIQGGCPEGTGTGGPGYMIEDEFHPELRHEDEGIISMANAGPNTGGSQFFITLVPTPWLDDRHAVFGKVVEGIEVVREIGAAETDSTDLPLKEVVIERITTGDAQ
jgi:peptidyl-prolyl cis-trans isomerase A (cyclophilin A)